VLTNRFFNSLFVKERGHIEKLFRIRRTRTRRKRILSDIGVSGNNLSPSLVHWHRGRTRVIMHEDGSSTEVVDFIHIIVIVIIGRTKVAVKGGHPRRSCK
jgi:hypothetical protein